MGCMENKIRKAIKSYKRAKKLIDKMDGDYINDVVALETAIKKYE